MQEFQFQNMNTTVRVVAACSMLEQILTVTTYLASLWATCASMIGMASRTWTLCLPLMLTTCLATGSKTRRRLPTLPLRCDTLCRLFINGEGLESGILRSPTGSLTLAIKSRCGGRRVKSKVIVLASRHLVCLMQLQMQTTPASIGVAW